jgi:phosphoglycerate dehydrogenase-like enzyme
VLAKADAVVSVLPRTDETINFFTKSLFEQMKPTAVFINIGRGPTVCEPDLIEALQSGKIAGAVLDVFATEPLPKESPLWDMKNVLITPHSACSDDRMEERCFDLVF